MTETAMGGWRERIALVRNVEPALVRAIASLLVFVLGIVGFHAAFSGGVPGPNDLGSNSLRSLALIIGRFPPVLNNRHLPITLSIARFVLPVISWWMSFHVAWRIARNPFRLWWRRFADPHLVIAGDDRVAGAMARAERKAGHGVIMWIDQPKASWVVELANLGAPHVEEGKKPLRSLLLRRARGVVLAGPDDTANLALADEIIDADDLRRRGSPLALIVRVDDPDLLAETETRLLGRGREHGIRTRLVSIPDIEARALLRSDVHDRVRRLGCSDPRIVCFGYSAAVERYLLRLLAGAYFSGGGRADITVLDIDAERRQRSFEARYPAAKTLAPVRFVVAPTDQPALAREIFDTQIGPDAPALVVIDLPSPPAALAAAYAADSVFATQGRVTPAIAVRLGRGQALKIAGPIFAFGGSGAYRDPETLLQEERDTFARSIHDFYLEGRLDHGEKLRSRESVRPWDELPEAVREDNRLLADLYSLKLRDLGARIVDGRGPSLEFTAHELETLAEAEHDRWMAARRLAGWSLGTAKDDAQRIHPDLIPYADLAEPVKQIDRDQILVLTRLLARVGKRAARDLLVAVPEGLPPGRVAAGLHRIAADYPDRVTIAIGDVRSAGIRTALIAAAAAGYRVQAVLDRAAKVLADTGPDRDQAAALLRSCDRLVVPPAGEDPAATVVQLAELTLDAGTSR